MKVNRLSKLERGNPRTPGRPRRAVSTRWVAAAAVVPTLGMLSACGGTADAEDSADSPYCSALSDAKPHFVTLQEGDVEKFDEAFAGFHELAGEAPTSIQEDWAAFDGALVDLEDDLAAIGLKVSDLAAVTAGGIPAGTDAGDLAQVPDLMLDLASPEFGSAATEIERHAIEECDIELAV